MTTGKSGIGVFKTKLKSTTCADIRLGSVYWAPSLNYLGNLLHNSCRLSADLRGPRREGRGKDEHDDKLLVNGVIYAFIGIEIHP